MQVNELPNCLKSGSVKSLRLKMIKNQIRLAATVRYFDIQFVNGFWYAWYYEPFNKSDEVNGDAAQDDRGQKL